MECKLSEYLFLMNTDASTIENINIPKSKNVLSKSGIESSGERSNIFRNRSFNLFRNERDFWKKRSDSVTLLESRSISTTNLYGSLRSCFQHFIRFPYFRRPLLVNVPFWVVWWAGAQYGSPYLFAAHLTSSVVRSGYQIWCQQSRQTRLDPLHGISIPNSSSALILLWLFLHLHLLVFFSTSL